MVQCGVQLPQIMQLATFVGSAVQKKLIGAMALYHWQALWVDANRYGRGQFFRELAKHCHELCPLFSLPGFTVQQVILGIFHVMGLGVTAYVLGNVLWEALDNTGLAHAMSEGRCALLWQKLRAYYNVNYIKYRMQNLTWNTTKPAGKPPKVKVECMQVRCIVVVWVAAGR